jgi:hypothetical protein
MNTLFQRNILDRQWYLGKGLPRAGESTYLDSSMPDVYGIDLGEVLPIRVEIECEVSVTASPGLVDCKSVVFVAQDSDDGVNYEPLPASITWAINGADGAGGPARCVRFRLPPDIRQYVAVKLTSDADAGDPTAGWAEFQLLF